MRRISVAIVYDRVNKFGGAERVLLALHEIFPNAPLYTSVYSPSLAKWADVFLEVRTSFLQKIPFLRDNHEFIPYFMPFAFSRFNFDEYDLVISVTSEFAKNIKVRNGKHICYLLTPTRYLWSHYEEYFKNKIFKKITFSIVKFLREIDVRSSKNPHKIIAISSEVQKRIKKYYGRSSEIIFPPVEKIKFNSKIKNKFKNYFLVVSRLVSYKKVDLVIEAFNELGLPLLIVGAGREEKKLKKKSRKNIHFVGYVKDEVLASYYKNARALVFPQEEDFGITAVEAQMYGVPVIAYRKGGALDTITNQTGVFFDVQNKESLIDAVCRFQKRKFEKRVIMKNAERFSKKRFKKEFLCIIPFTTKYAKRSG